MPRSSVWSGVSSGNIENVRLVRKLVLDKRTQMVYKKHILLNRETKEAGVKLYSASTESSAKLRAERKAGQQMGRGGQGEMGNQSIF